MIDLEVSPGWKPGKPKSLALSGLDVWILFQGSPRLPFEVIHCFNLAKIPETLSYAASCVSCAGTMAAGISAILYLGFCIHI